MKFNFVSKLPLTLLCTALLMPGMPLFADPPTSDDSDHDAPAANTMVPDPAAGAPTADPAATDGTAAPATDAESTAPTMTPDQLDNLVAPIALYPDTLVSQVMVASTYPLEIVQAEQWIQAHPELKGSALTSAAAQQNWDPSVQALVVFPDVMKRLSEDVTWVTNLGNAFLANQGSVMDAVQRMRTKAEQSGKLSTTPQEKVNTTTQDGRQVIEIQPANPEVIYVPTYNPDWIWGPSLYYPYPGWDYPARPSVGYYYWGGGFAIGACFVGWHSWNDWGWHPGWYGHHVVVNNTFITHYNFNRNVVVNRTVMVHGTARSEAVWAHNPDHRLGVAYGNRTVAAQYHPERFRAVHGGAPGVRVGAPGAHIAAVGHPGMPVDRRPVNAAQAQVQLHQASVRAQSAGASERFGNRQINNSNYNRSAFSGMNQGAASRVHSTRGYQSLGHTGGAPHTGGGAVSHGGGGAVSHGGGGGGGGAARGGGGAPSGGNGGGGGGHGGGGMGGGGGNGHH